ncbi:NAD-dependent DNA ligase [Wiseana iridescent virus]|uniref:DNA ligase (NAD(+)) n=1 Tax=Wiseana iridescent virus TaxID=68347 RepID=G0T5D6_IRV9|nr:NAD-dependent DNA ligase [Wiseana iridescent virus]ADO00454.1 hypothetical protein [Wiseana iridescent virus]
MDQLQLKELKKRADDAYFNSGSPIMSDNDYDTLVNQIDDVSVGCLPKTDRVELPVYLGSLNKYNDDKTIINFLGKFNQILVEFDQNLDFLIQEKLDGVSCLYVYRKSKVQLFTRGNGLIGTEITHLLKYGLKVPIIPSSVTNFMVRGELILSKKIFEKKYASEFKNIRNMVSGQVAKKNPERTIISNIDFVAYELIEPQLKYQKPVSEQYDFLKNHGFLTVYNRLLDITFINQETLTDYLIRRKKKSQYQIDGLVITVNQKYIRNEDGNPKYSFAFKIQGEVSKAEVECVMWNLSKGGKYKPQIKIKPVVCSGVTITSLSGFNAKFIVENKISRGTILSITRSGDVIPHILAVVSNGDGKLNLPKNSKWNSVELYHTFEQAPDEVIVKQMVHFFTSLKCLNCKDKTILKIYNSGKKTIEEIVQSSPEELSPFVGNKVAIKLLDSTTSNIKTATTHQLLAALNVFGEGIGLKKIQLLNFSTVKESLKIKGLSEATIKEKILPNLNYGLTRVVNLKKLVGGAQEVEEIENRCGPLNDKIFVFTGFRDASLEKQINNLGGKVTSAISKKTTDLIVLSNNHKVKSSTKLLKAKNLGIKISTKTELMTFLISLVQLNSKEEIDYSDYSDDEGEP